MKTKDKQALHTKTIEELKKLLQDLKSALFSLSLDKTQNKLKNTRSIYLKRKEIAQIATVLREKELKL
ncbi:MAG: 50S ribosomal protein L29 [Candidatus Levybacteria bacterium]|nr:50S ribosomal protein L29 [Candidatus Levybacteria bacterium]